MIELLSRIFIKNRENVTDPNVRSAYGMLCGTVGIFLNVILFFGKFFAGRISGSIAVVADAFNNLSDAGSSVVTLIGFRMSNKKPDPGHPFGHGRIEYISGLIVSMIIVVMGFELLISSVEKIIEPAETEFSILTLVILCVSLIVKLYMSFYNKSVGKKISSAAMAATSADSLSDCIATSVVIISTLVAYFFRIEIDAYCGIGVAVFILIAGVRAALETVSPLLGQPPEPEFIKSVSDIVMSYPEIRGIHDLIVHDYGPGRLMVSLHAEVPANGDLLTVHDVIDNAERKLSESLGCHAVIHMDPVVTDDEHISSLRKELSERIKAEISPKATLHDFRAVTGPTHTNLIFDVVVPFAFEMSDSEVKEKVGSIVSGFDGNYFAVINIDKSYAVLP